MTRSQLLVCVGRWVLDQRAGRVRGQSRGGHPSGAPAAFLLGLVRALRAKGVAVVFVPEPYTSMHCSRLRPDGRDAHGRPMRCCAVVEQDLPTARADGGAARKVHAQLRCPVCNDGRVREHRDYAGARGIWADVRDMIAHEQGRFDDITSTPDRWALVLAAWARGAELEREARAEAGADDVGRFHPGRAWLPSL